MLKKNLIIALLSTFCLTSTLFIVIPAKSSTKGSSNSLPYDPWLDLNDDGIIDIYDITWLCAYYDISGTPINKTELLLNVNDTYTELLSKIHSLNASLVSLQEKTDNLEALFAGQQSQIASLLEIVGALEANYSAMNLTIPSNSTYGVTTNSTSEMYSWSDMAAMSVSITLNRTSHMLIMWSAEATQSDWRQTIYVRAEVGASAAIPGMVTLTPIVHDVAGHTHPLDWSVYSYIFYKPSVTAGDYTIKMQWKVSGGVGSVRYRTLTAIALP